MSPGELQAGHDWVTNQFYRPWRIVRRLWRHLWRPSAWSSLITLAALNVAYFGRTFHWRIRGWDPAAGTKENTDARAAGQEVGTRHSSLNVAPDLTPAERQLAS